LIRPLKVLWSPTLAPTKRRKDGARGISVYGSGE
jgi:hypothetical protein